MSLQRSDSAAGDACCDRCVLCGMGPMPVRHELPDGCGACPGCVTDSVFADLLAVHDDDTTG